MRDGLEGLRNDNQALRAENKALRDENLSLREEASSLRTAVAEVRSKATHWSLAIEHCRSLGCRIDECESKVAKMEKEVKTSNETIAAMAGDANRTAETTMTSASTLLNEKIQMAIKHIDRVQAQLDEKIAQQGETFNQSMLLRWESLSQQLIENNTSKDVDFSSQVKHSHSEEGAEAATQLEGLKNELSAHLLQLHDHNTKIDRLIDNDAMVQGTIADVNASISKLFKYISKNCTTHTERSKLVESIDKIRESISNHSASELDRDKLVCIRINNIHAAIERLYKHCERLERHLESKLNDIDVNFTKHDKLFMTLLQ
jgi:chromosome segregation ATPase